MDLPNICLSDVRGPLWRFRLHLAMECARVCASAQTKPYFQLCVVITDQDDSSRLVNPQQPLCTVPRISLVLQCQNSVFTAVCVQLYSLQHEYLSPAAYVYVCSLCVHLELLALP